MKLIVISNPTDLNVECEIINALFELGLNCFHLRKPHSDINEVNRLLMGIDADYYPHLALHQHHELATEFGIKRLHFTERARSLTNPQLLEMYLEQGYTLSTSIHALSAIESLSHFDYVFYGPVFNSLSKPDYQGVIAENFKLKHTCKIKIIALGGITSVNIDVIREMNFDGVAIIGSIWNEPKHAVENFKTFINLFNDEN